MTGPKPGKYALYKGDELLATGTIKEIAQEMGVNDDTIRYYSSPYYAKGGKQLPRRRLVKLERGTSVVK